MSNARQPDAARRISSRPSSSSSRGLLATSRVIAAACVATSGRSRSPTPISASVRGMPTAAASRAISAIAASASGATPSAPPICSSCGRHVVRDVAQDVRQQQPDAEPVRRLRQRADRVLQRVRSGGAGVAERDACAEAAVEHLLARVEIAAVRVRALERWRRSRVRPRARTCRRRRSSPWKTAPGWSLQSRGRTRRGERLDRVCECVDPTDRGDARRAAQRQDGIADRNLRNQVRTRHADLEPPAGIADDGDRRHLRARARGRRDGDDRGPPGRERRSRRSTARAGRDGAAAARRPSRRRCSCRRRSRRRRRCSSPAAAARHASTHASGRSGSTPSNTTKVSLARASASSAAATPAARGCSGRSRRGRCGRAPSSPARATRSNRARTASPAACGGFREPSRDGLLAQRRPQLLQRLPD